MNIICNIKTNLILVKKLLFKIVQNSKFITKMIRDIKNQNRFKIKIP